MESKIGGRFVIDGASVRKSGQSVVCIARDERLERKCFVKILSSPTEASKERFLREAKILASVPHPSCCAIYDFIVVSKDEIAGTPLARDGFGDIFDSNGQAFLIAEEFAEGTPLREMIDGENFISRQGIARGIEILISAADTLRVISAKGIVHRDIKAANIFVNEDNSVTIVDFGISLLKGAEPLTGDYVMGTVEYMSPEQISGGTVDRRTDLYSLGIVAYQMFTGQLPFPKEAVLRLSAQLHAQNPSALNRNVSSRLREIILRLLEKEPEDRYQSCEELIQDLSALRRKPAGAGTKIALTVVSCGFLFSAALLSIGALNSSNGAAASRSSASLEEIRKAVESDDAALARRLVSENAASMSEADRAAASRELESLEVLKRFEYGKISAGTVAEKKMQRLVEEHVRALEGAKFSHEFVTKYGRARDLKLLEFPAIRAIVSIKSAELVRDLRARVINDLNAEKIGHAESEYGGILELVAAGLAERDYSLEFEILRLKVSWTETVSDEFEKDWRFGEVPEGCDARFVKSEGEHRAAIVVSSANSRAVRMEVPEHKGNPKGIRAEFEVLNPASADGEIALSFGDTGTLSIRPGAISFVSPGGTRTNLLTGSILKPSRSGSCKLTLEILNVGEKSFLTLSTPSATLSAGLLPTPAAFSKISVIVKDSSIKAAAFRIGE